MKVIDVDKVIAEILDSWPKGDDKFTQGICQGLRAAVVILQKHKPPVNVGDMLYPIFYDRIAGGWLVGEAPEKVTEIGTKGFFVSCDLDDPEAPDEFHPYDEIGDEWFRTYEEAVAATKVKAKPEWAEEWV